MPDSTPDLFFDAVNSYHKTAAMMAAIDLGLFTAIAEGADTPAALAAKVGATERGARILADCLTIQGFLTKAEGVYALTPSSATFLDERSPAYLGSAKDFLASPEFLAMVFADPAAVVRSGGSLGLGNIGPDNPIWNQVRARDGRASNPDGSCRRGPRSRWVDAAAESVGYRRGSRNVWHFRRARRTGSAGRRAGLGRRSRGRARER
jgi:hypothetical protein